MANNTALHGPGLDQTPWLVAMEAQLHAQSMVQYLIDALEDHPTYASRFIKNPLNKQWHIDQQILREATPFAWGKDPIAAVMVASRSMPGDAQINGWNLETNAAWWHFETPLPIQTVHDPENEIHALSFGWTYQGSVACFVVTCWIADPMNDANWRSRFGRLIPSQVWTWFEGDSLTEMLDKCRREHQKLYGPGGKYYKESAVGEDIFMAATETISKFILAGFAWMAQKILVTPEGQLPRQRRKELQRKTRSENFAKVVQLRRVERQITEVSDHDGPPRQWTCRWEVDGHWRNQVCGVGRSDRRLTWINPFLKGPADLPLRIPRHKVYQVTR